MPQKEKYVPTRKAIEILGVHVLTLHNWEKAGKIDTMRTGGGHRLYNVDKYLRDNGKNYDTDECSVNSKILEKKKNVKKDKEIIEKKDTVTDNKKENICYIRVPSVSNKKILKNEKDYMKEKYPKYTIIEDIGSSLNFNKDGFKKIIDLAVEGKINNLIITDINIIPTYGYEMLDYLVKQHSGGKIIIDSHNKNSSKKSILIDEISQIFNTCTSKISELKNELDDLSD